MKKYFYDLPKEIDGEKPKDQELILCLADACGTDLKGELPA